MKKYLLLPVLFALIVSMPFTAFASGPVTFTADTSAITNVQAGQSFEVPIRVTNNPGIAGVDLIVTLGAGLEWDYDSETYDRDEASSATWPYIPGDSVALTSRPASMGTATEFGFINVNSPPASFNSIGDGVLITLKLKASANATPGSTLTVGVNVTACGNAAAVSLASDSINGNVNVLLDTPVTGISDIRGHTFAMIAFLLISAALWGYILRRRLINADKGA